jgi:hypothetical protein
MTELRRPVHLAVLAGLSASAYAGSLALVTMLQSSADAALIAERAPIREAADAVAASHDDLEATVAAAMRRYTQMTDRYGALLPKLAGVETSLDTLAETTAGVTDSTLSLPSHVSLPAVQVAPRVIRIAPPAIQATTGASGR